MTSIPDLSTAFDIDEVHLYLHRTFGQDEGYIALSFGDGYLENGVYKFSIWQFSTANWPVSTKWPMSDAEIDALDEEVHKRVSEGQDIYICPMLRTEPMRVKWTGAGGRTVWADLDGGAHIPKQLEDYVTLIASGSLGHYHAYIQLYDFVDPQTIERLNKAFMKVSHADKGKWANNDVLRLPGTVNFKHGTPVKTVKEAKYSVNSSELMHALRFHLPHKSEVNPTPEEYEAVQVVEVVPIHKIPRLIRELLKEKSGDDRSRQSYFFIASCYEAGFSVDLTYTLALHHQPTVDKFSYRENGIKWEVLDVVRKLEAKHDGRR